MRVGSKREIISLNNIKENFEKLSKLWINLLLLTKLINFLDGCELSKRVLYIGMR